MTGSAIAIPLLGAASAHAADTATWDRLAQCESEGDWSAESNGHYGGLQMTQEMWVTHGGLDYAVSADQATRSEQIAVAEKVLATKGPSAWPYCAILVGLSPDESPSPSASDDGSGSQPDPSDSASASADPSPSASSDTTDKPSQSSSSSQSSPSSDSSDSPSPSASDDSGASSGGVGGSSDQGGASDGSGRHRGDSAHEGGGRSGEEAGRHASRQGGHADEVYTVRPGDNLWAIAQAHDLKGGWRALYEANKGTVGGDPDLILPGQRLDLG